MPCYFFIYLYAPLYYDASYSTRTKYVMYFNGHYVFTHLSFVKKVNRLFCEFVFELVLDIVL